uniref:Uncharacterized protein n=2 Tax=Picea TaxID=3328 RepID=A0A101M025_PICGL|nr:hypothetical protein ABT39_MTgene4551 [Picea glauca]QHR87863.1 hypothetical protein Q903MT_gene1875 [Picea sitchensis]QHR92741.1 hypothetical protein Q903MT_gene6789 [Picea sitchensis]
MLSYALKLGNERDYLLNFGSNDSLTLWGLSLKPGTCMGRLGGKLVNERSCSLNSAMISLLWGRQRTSLQP